MTAQELPKTHRALMQHVYAEPLKVETIATPQPTPGSAIVRMLYSNVISYQSDIYNGVRKYTYPTPLVTGISGIGRIAAVGPDSVLLAPGQLVLIDAVIRGRDDASAIFLSGIAEGGSEGSKKLMHGEWRDSTYAEFHKAPLENCFPLNEAKLCGKTERGLGYEIPRLAQMASLLVPFGGLRDIGLVPGETVIIAPATGQFGGAAVMVALAMGARVIAMGRNPDSLKRLKALSGRVETVRITGDYEQELAALKAFGEADVYFDISPIGTAGAGYFKAAILSLGHGGRISFMGGWLEDVQIPIRQIMRKDLKLHGKWMYSREDVRVMIKMMEAGVLGLREEDGVEVVGVYPLEKWEEAFEAAKKNAMAGQVVLLKP